MSNEFTKGFNTASSNGSAQFCLEQMVNTAQSRESFNTASSNGSAQSGVTQLGRKSMEVQVFQYRKQ